MTTISSPPINLTPAGIRSYILEGVDNLRIRKCRPDKETIAHYVLRKYGGTLSDIFNELENIVDEGILLKVEYKGSTSYRTPESFDQKNSPLLTKHSKILNSSRTTRLILTSINDLLAQNPEYCTIGIPIEELKSKLTALEPVRFQDDKLNVAFSREVSIGNVLLGDGGRVYPKDIQPRKNALKPEDQQEESPEVKVPKKRGRKSNAERMRLQAEKEAGSGSGSGSGGEAAVVVAAATTTTTTTTTATTTAAVVVATKTETPAPVPKKEASDDETINEKVQEAVRKTFDGRVSGRNKRKTKVFDPSDVAPSVKSQPKKKKRGSATSVTTMDSCEICNKKSDKGLVICATCAASFHLHCLGLNESSWSDWNEWVCIDCRICNACSTLLKNMKHTECGKCKSGFHVACVGEEDGFVCGDCVFKSDPDSINQTQSQSESPSTNSANNSTTSIDSAPKKRKGRPRKDQTNLPKGRQSEPPSLGKSSVSPTTETTATTINSNNCSQSEKDVKSEGDESMTEDEQNEGDEAESNSLKLNVAKEGGGENGSEANTNTSAPEAVDGEKPVNNGELNVKNCNEWTPAHVEQYFSQNGLAEAGALFREQEVDGLSLLLMKRSDVIFGMRLRLGPALKVYKLILSLQSNS